MTAQDPTGASLTRQVALLRGYAGARVGQVPEAVGRLLCDLVTHADAISGEDGTLAEHGPCLVCEVLYAD